MDVTQNTVITFWAVAATVWIRTNRRIRPLPPTKLRANAAIGLGVLCVLIGSLGLVGRVGTISENTALIFTAPVYFILSAHIRARGRQAVPNRRSLFAR